MFHFKEKKKKKKKHPEKYCNGAHSPRHNRFRHISLQCTNPFDFVMSKAQRTTTSFWRKIKQKLMKIWVPKLFPILGKGCDCFTELHLKIMNKQKIQFVDACTTCDKNYFSSWSWSSRSRPSHPFEFSIQSHKSSWKATIWAVQQKTRLIRGWSVLSQPIFI